MSFSTLLPYIIVSISIILIPGPDMLFVLTQSISSGNRAGILTIIGSITGTLVHTLLAAAGLTIILQQSALAFHIVKIVGAIYLLYLALQSFREPVQPLTIIKSNQKGNHFFRKGFMMNLSNPKVPIFFLTFFPQFVNHQIGHESLQIILFGLIFIVETFIFFTIISLGAGLFRKKMAESKIFQNSIKYIKGTVFGGLGLKLLFLGR